MKFFRGVTWSLTNGKGGPPPGVARTVAPTEELKATPPVSKGSEVRLRHVYEIDETYSMSMSCSGDPDLPFLSLNPYQSALQNNFDSVGNTLVEAGAGMGELALLAAAQAISDGQRVIMLANSVEQAGDIEKEASASWGISDITVISGDTCPDHGKLIITTADAYISAIRKMETWTCQGLLIIDERDKKLSSNRSVVIESVITFHVRSGGTILMIADELPKRDDLIEHLDADLFIMRQIDARGSVKIHVIPPDYPCVKDPKLPKYKLLNPVQSYVLHNYNPESNCVLESGTGTGKTVIAYSVSRPFLDAGKRVVYMAPKREILAGVERDVMEMWGGGVAARNTGDPVKLKGKSFIMTTPEGYISAVRQQREWALTAELLIVDEGHYIFGLDRGGVVDAAITIHTQRGGKVFVMSGTLPNKKELAAHLKAELFTSSWVKTKLNDDPWVEAPDDIDAIEAPKELGKGFVTTLSGFAYRKESLRLKKIKDMIVQYEGQFILIFVPNKAAGYCLSEELDVPFYTADLEDADKKKLIYEFTEGVCKIMIATNALSEGVNTPADVVIVCGTRGSKHSMHYADIVQIKQMFGRAGRDKNEGLAFAIGDVSELFHAKKLFVVPMLPLPLESMLLTVLSERSATRSDLVKIMEGTYAATMLTSAKLDRAVGGYLAFLRSTNILVETEGRFSLTVEGSIIARFFIPPGDYVGYMKIARKLMAVATPKPAPPPPVESASPSAWYETSLKNSNKVVAVQKKKEETVFLEQESPAKSVMMSSVEKGCILISMILAQASGRDCSPKLLNDYKMKLISLGLEEAVNPGRARLIMHYITDPAAMSPYFKFQINDVGRWQGMFKDMLKHKVHEGAVPGSAEIDLALVPLKSAIEKNKAILDKKAAEQKKALAKKKAAQAAAASSTRVEHIKLAA